MRRSHYAIERLLYNAQYIRSKEEDELLCVGFAKKDFSPSHWSGCQTVRCWTPFWPRLNDDHTSHFTTNNFKRDWGVERKDARLIKNKETLRQAFICLRPITTYRYPLPPYTLHTLHTCIHYSILYLFTQGRGGGVEPERRLEVKNWLIMNGFHDTLMVDPLNVMGAASSLRKARDAMLYTWNQQAM